MSDTDIFYKRETTLDDLAKAGWTIEGAMSGRLYFRHSSGETHPIPEWVQHAMERRYKLGVMDTQRAIKRAIGLEGK